MSPAVKKAVFAAAAAAVMLVLAFVAIPAPLAFKSKLATEVVPDLPIAIIAIAGFPDAPRLQSSPDPWFSLVDVVPTAGALAGGMTAISAFGQHIGTSVDSKGALVRNNS